jgi:hypothetical protein
VDFDFIWVGNRMHAAVTKFVVSLCVFRARCRAARLDVFRAYNTGRAKSAGEFQLVSISESKRFRLSLWDGH